MVMDAPAIRSPCVSPPRNPDRIGRSGQRRAPGAHVPSVEVRRTSSTGVRRMSPPPREPQQPYETPPHEATHTTPPQRNTAPQAAHTPATRHSTTSTTFDASPTKYKDVLSKGSAGLLREAKRLSELAHTVEAALRGPGEAGGDPNESLWSRSSVASLPAASAPSDSALQAKADALEREVYELKRGRRNQKALQSSASVFTERAAEEMRGLREALAAQKKDVLQMKEQLRHMSSPEIVSAGIKSRIQRMVEEAYEQGLRDGKRDVETKFIESERQRSSLHQRLQEVMGTVQVVVRVRPYLPYELREAGFPKHTAPTVGSKHLQYSNKNAGSTFSLDDSGASLVPRLTDTISLTKAASASFGYLASQNGSTTSFTFDAVLTAEATQSDVFSEVSSIPVSVLDGYNCCVLAYGQTGSGKTHTMLGSNGVITSVLFEIYEKMKVRETEGSYSYRLFVSVTEVYNDSVRDLLYEGNTVHMGQHCEYEIVEAERDIAAALLEGERQRAVGISNMNEHSSRSHCAVLARVEGTLLGNKKRGERDTAGQVFLVDLAGSERIPSAQNPDQTLLRETQHINKSLASLGDVIHALSVNASHIPYRNSRLTQHLSACLCRNSKVVVIANISPAPVSQVETLCTLQFAARLKTVHLGEARVRGSSGSVVSTSASTPQRGVSALNPRRVQGYGEDVGVQRRNSRSNSMRSTRSGRSSEGGAHRASSMNSSRVSEHINTRSARTNSPRVFGGGGTNMKREKRRPKTFLSTQTSVGPGGREHRSRSAPNRH